jgi:hypothetical protein
MSANRLQAGATLGDVGCLAKSCAALANHGDLHITLTLLIGIALGCGVLYWSGNRTTPAPSASIPPAPPAALPRAPDAPSILKPVVAQSIERASGRPASRDPVQETPPSNYDGPDLPVAFAIAERFLYTTEENDEGSMINVSKRVKEGIISNSSDKPLTITAIEVNIATQDASQTQFVLSGGTQMHFGPDQGLKMISGDQMTLRSPSYKDFVQQIP